MTIKYLVPYQVQCSSQTSLNCKFTSLLYISLHSPLSLSFIFSLAFSPSLSPSPSSLLLFSLSTQTSTTSTIGGNLLTGSIPEEVIFAPLGSINLTSNFLTGTIPEFQWENLTMISIAHNQLTGTLPPGVLTFAFNVYVPRLLHLSLLTHTRASPLLLMFSFLPSVSVISLSGLLRELNDNYLTGSIPLTEGLNHSNIMELNLGDNPLSGTFPPGFGSVFSSLSSFYMRNTQMTGNLTELMGYANLLELDLSASIHSPNKSVPTFLLSSFSSSFSYFLSFPLKVLF
jgi:hypothetical protein